MLMRLFVAIPVPAEVLPALQRAQKTLLRAGKGNASLLENLHITLAFLGETDRCAEAQAALRTVQAAPVSVTLAGAGHFRDVCWAGVTLTPELAALQRQTAAALRAAQFRLDSRAFRPHLTLCRRFRPADAIEPALPEVSRALGEPCWQAEEILLMHSHRVEGVLTYTPVERVRLQA